MISTNMSAATASRYHMKTAKLCERRYFSSPQITMNPLTAEAMNPARNCGP